MTGRTGYLAATWAAISSAIALFWTVTGRGYPFGGDEVSLLNHLPAKVGAPLFAVGFLATAVLAFAMAGRYAVRLRGLPRLALLTVGWLIVAALLFVLPTMDLLAVAGYAPMLILGAPFGWPDVDYATVFTWPLFFQFWSFVGGVLLARAVLKWQLASKKACVVCGRSESTPRWMTAASARRWGRWAAYVAAVVPVLYAVTRLAWFAGIPLGIPASFLHEMQDNGAVFAAGGLGGFAVAGGVLTLGLVQRWGEVFPRWMVGLAGKRVPIKLATVPATVVSIFVMTASVSILGTGSELVNLLGEGSLTVLPMVLWPVWSVALGGATLAYYLRRRGRCPVCGLG